MAKKKAGSSMSVAAVGAGLAAVAAAAAGTYFLYGSKKATKHRKEVKAWSLKARGEILEQLERLFHLHEKAFQVVQVFHPALSATMLLLPYDVLMLSLNRTGSMFLRRPLQPRRVLRQ